MVRTLCPNCKVASRWQLTAKLTILSAMARRCLSILLVMVCAIAHLPAQTQGPYRLDVAREGVLAAGGATFLAAGLALGGSIEPLSIDAINSLSRSDVPAIDRGATYNYSVSLKSTSNWLEALLILAPVGLFASPDVRNDAGTVTVMYLETVLLANALTQFTKSLTTRTRPFVYNESAPLDEKQEKDARRSFFSGHAANSFASAVFLSTVFAAYFPQSPWKPVVWAASLAAAATVAYLRVAAGQHFPTDVLTGMIVGSTVGYLVPELHRSDGTAVGIAPAPLQRGYRLALSIQF